MESSEPLLRRASAEPARRRAADRTPSSLTERRIAAVLFPTGIHAVESRGTVRRDSVDGLAETAKEIAGVSPVGPVKNDVDPERGPLGSPALRIDSLLGKDDGIAHNGPGRTVITIFVPQKEDAIVRADILPER